MITLELKGTNLAIKTGRSDYATFTTVLNTLKEQRCRYNTALQEWITSAFRYQELKEILEDLDTIEDKVDLKELEALDQGDPEQKIESIRRIPDYSLLNFPPITGKHPHENFQKQAISSCINKSRYACYFGMGSGKSYIAAATIAHRLYKYRDCSKVLFITTNIGVRNLYHELFKFIKDLDPEKVKIADKDYRNPFDDPSTDIVVTSYNSFRLICEYYKKQQKITSKMPRKPFLPLKKWSQDKPLMLILDESHEVSHAESQRTGLVMLHASLFEYRYEFTGTAADKPEKSYPQLTILDKWLTYNLTFGQWKERMAILGDRFSPYAIRGWKHEELEKQNQRFLQNHGASYKNTELVELPNYNEKKIYLTMNPTHRKIYEDVVLQDLSNQHSTRDVVNRFPYMMLAVDNPFLLQKHEDKFDDNLNNLLSRFKETQLEKISALEDIISDRPGEKIIVWAIHPLTIHMLAERFKKLNPIAITGETKESERFDLVEDFKKGDHQLLIANIQCLNSSVTITECSCQVYFERGFTYTSYEQSTCRIYRTGQTEDVDSYILLYSDSLDLLLDKNLESKGTLVRGLMSKEFISQEIWQQIFNCSEEDTFDSF